MLTPRSSLADTLRRGAAMIPEDFMADGMPEAIPATRETL